MNALLTLYLLAGLAATEAAPTQATWVPTSDKDIFLVRDGVAAPVNNTSLTVSSGQSILVELNGARATRVVAEGVDFVPGLLDVLTSDDARMFVQDEWHDITGGPLVWRASRTAEPRYLLLQHNGRRGARDLQLSVFLERIEALPPPPFLHRVEVSDSPQLALLREGRSDQVLWRLDPYAPWRIKVDGPARLRVEARAEFADPREHEAKSFTLNLVRAGEERSLRFVAGLDPEAVTRDWPSPGLGRRKQGYYEVPKGRHEVDLRTSIPVWVEIRTVTPSDLTLSRVPLGPTPLPAADATRPADPRTIGSQLDELTWPQLEQASIDLLRNNTVRGARLAGLAMARSLADQPGHPAISRRRSVELANEYTTFRALTPIGASGNIKWFRFLLPIAFRSQDLHIREDGLQTAASATLLGAFHELTPEGGNRSYEVGVSPAERRARLAFTVSDPRGSRATVRVYDALGAELHQADLLTFPHPLRANPVTLGEAALARLQQGGSLDAKSGTRPPYGSRLAAAPLVDPAVGQLLLPKGARELRVSSPDRGVTTEAALFIEDVPQFSLAEQELLHYLGLQPAGDSLAQRLTTLRTESSQALDDRRQFELANHYRPALHLLEIRAGELGRSVEPRPVASRNNQFTDPPPAGTPHKVLRRLASAQLARELTPAELDVEIQILQELGESYLAEQKLQQAVLYGSSALRDRAQSLLEDAYQAGSNTLGLTRLHAWKLFQDPNPATLQTMVSTLLASGREDFALDLALLLPASNRDLSLLLPAARRGWWRTFDELLIRVSEPERPTWSAFGALIAGIQPEVSGLPAALRERLQQAQGIRAALDRGDASALANWYGFSLPAPTRMESNRRLVLSSAGSARTLSVHNTVASSSWVASSEDPVVLEVTGPRRLQLEMRPVHEDSLAIEAGISRLDTWIEIETMGQLRSVPVLGNRPSSDIEFAQPHIFPSASAPGRRELVDVEVGLGAWKIRIWPRHGRVLLRALAEDAAAHSLHLPPAQPGWVLPHSAQRRDQRNTKLTPRVCIHGAAEVRCASAQSFSSPLETATELRGCTGCSQDPFLRAVRSGYSALESTAAHEAATFLLESDSEDPEEENTDGENASGLGTLASLLDTQRRSPHLDDLQARLTAASRWRQLTSVQSSGGVQQRSVVGFQPESPTLKTRTSLLGHLDPETHVVYGSRAIGVTLGATRTVEASFQALQVPPLRKRDLEVLWRIDDLAEQNVVLTPDEPLRGLRITVPEGSRSLRIYVRQPQPNQYLGVRLWELRAGRRLSIVPETRRTYQVATSQAPLRLRVQGPGTVRIDALDGQETLTSNEQLEAGWQVLALQPMAGRDRTLYRVFQQVIDRNDDRPSPSSSGLAASPRTRTAQMETFPKRTTDRNTPRIVYQEERASTLSLMAGVTRRRLLDEDFDRDLPADEFLEARATQRKSNKGATVQRELRLIGRVRDGESDTLGAGATWRIAPPTWPVTLRLNASGFVQDALGGSAWAGTARASAGRTMRLTDSLRHRPQVSLFYRHLSLDEDERDLTDRRFDQDVYTRYKSRHRAGIEISDTLTYALRLDTQLFARGALRSNEELDPTDPDRAELQLGVRQYLRPLLLDFRVRHAVFFDDDDRNRSVERTRLSVDLEFERWNEAFERWAFESSLNYDLATDELTGALLFGRHFSAGRALRDFLPSPGDFRNLRLFRRKNE